MTTDKIIADLHQELSTALQDLPVPPSVRDAINDVFAKHQTIAKTTEKFTPRDKTEEWDFANKPSIVQTTPGKFEVQPKAKVEDKPTKK